MSLTIYTSETTPLAGRCPFSVFSPILGKIREIAARLFSGFKNMWTGAGSLPENLGVLARFLQISVFLTSVIEIATTRPGRFLKLGLQLQTAQNVNGLCDIPEGIRYFASEDVKKDSIYNNVGNGMMLAASVGSTALLLDECELLNLGAVSAKMGSVPVLGAAAGVASLEDWVNAITIFGYGCIGADAIRRIVHGETSREKDQAWMDLTWSVAEIAAKTFKMLAGYTLIGISIGLEAFAASLGLAAYFHRLAPSELELKLV